MRGAESAVRKARCDSTEREREAGSTEWWHEAGARSLKPRTSPSGY